MTDIVDKVVAAVLYEGYVLWPYRRSATKNRQRWTLGGVHPRAFSEAGGGYDPWQMRTECLIVGARPVVHVAVRFLQVVQRQARRLNPDGSLVDVDELRVGGERHLTWEEAAERKIETGWLDVAALTSSRHVDVAIAAGCDEEPLTTPSGETAGQLVRHWRDLAGTVEIKATSVQDGVFRLSVTISNTTPLDSLDRARALEQTFVSTHTLLTVYGGDFVSLTDPPPDLKTAAEACQNAKTWPVLVGEEGDRHRMISSPIILYDYPRIAPESPGDLFDGTEIDQLLTLNVLTLTDAEKEEVRATDPRAREILDRTEALSPEELMGLNGAIRELRMLRPEGPVNPLFNELERPAPRGVMVDGVELTPGSRVRLRPRPGGDVLDLALAGKIAIVESIEQDYDERVHLAVTLEDDPGRDLGKQRQPGHLFFFSPAEVEPAREESPADGRGAHRWQG